MAKMVNPNTVSNMDLINAKSQAKMQQLVQKIGKKSQCYIFKNVKKLFGKTD